MRLDELDDPLSAWLYAERYLGAGTRTYSPFSAVTEVDEAYHPQRGPAFFDMPSFWVPDERGGFLQNSFVSPVIRHYRRPGRFLLPVHPDTLAWPGLAGRDELLSCAPGPVLRVVPSANTRTVLVRRIGGEPVEAHFVKLHFPRKLSRFTRRLRRPIIELQLWVADELAGAGLPVLPEVGGGVFGTDPDEAWGFLLRECAPRDGDALPYTIPVFALYGRDHHRRGDETLLAQLIDASGADPAEYVAERVVAPLVALWLRTVLTTGCTAEPHGQNTLLRLSADGAGTRVLYRDCGIYVDPALRAELGLTRALPRVNVLSKDIAVPREQVWSLAYDSFLGHHTLQRLAELLTERFGVPADRLHRAARAAFHEGRGDTLALPDTVYYYDDTVTDSRNWRLVDLGQVPRWR